MALTSISDFKSSLNYGSRSNLFKVNFTFPTLEGVTLTTATIGNDKDVDVLCKSAAIPSMTVGIIEVPFRGRRVKVPGDRVFGDWTATFYSDSEHRIRQAFLQWSNYIKNLDQTNETLGATNVDYYGAINLDHLKADGSVSRYYKLYQVFPTEVGAIDLSYDTTDALEEFTVTFQYQYMDSSSTEITE